MAVLDDTGDWNAPRARAKSCAARICARLSAPARRKSLRSAGINLSIARGEMIAIVGPSGSRKEHFAAPAGCAGHSNKRCSILRREFAPIVLQKRSWRSIAIAPWVLSGSGITCCRISRRRKMWRCLLLVRGVALAQALRTAAEWLGEVGLADRAEQRAGAAIRGRTTARGDCASAGESARPYCWPTSRPGIWTNGTPRAIFELMRALASLPPSDVHSGNAQPFTGPARRPCSGSGTRSIGAGRRSAAAIRGSSAARPASAGATTPGERG